MKPLTVTTIKTVNRFNGGPATEHTTRIYNVATLTELLPLIEAHLRGDRFYFDGHLEIVKDEEVT